MVKNSRDAAIVWALFYVGISFGKKASGSSRKTSEKMQKMCASKKFNP